MLLLAQDIACALSFALPSAGNNMAARMAMMAMTTRSSIKVNPDRFGVDFLKTEFVNHFMKFKVRSP